MAETEEKIEVPGKKSPLAAVILLINLLAVAGIGAYMLFFRKAEAPATSAAAPAAAAPQLASDIDLGTIPGGGGPLVRLDNFIVNLADEEMNRYLKVSISLELVQEKAQETLKNKEPLVRDAVITLLGSQTYAEIRNTAGKKKLREQLVRAINAVLAAPLVRGVYFNEFVVQ